MRLLNKILWRRMNCINGNDNIPYGDTHYHQSSNNGRRMEDQGFPDVCRRLADFRSSQGELGTWAAYIASSPRLVERNSQSGADMAN